MEETALLKILQDLTPFIESMARIYARRCRSVSYRDMVAEIHLVLIEVCKSGRLEGVQNVRSYLERVAKRTAWKMAKRCREEENTQVSVDDLEFLKKRLDEEDIAVPCEGDVEELALNRLFIDELLSYLSPKHAALLRDLFFQGYDLSSPYIVTTYGNGSGKKVRKMYHYILKKLQKVAKEHGLEW